MSLVRVAAIGVARPRTLVLAVGLGTFVLLASVVLTGLTNGAGRLVGGVDFIAYWAGFDIATAGGDPYDAEQVLVAQRELQPSRGIPQVYLNPPWTLVLLAPVLALPFELAVSVWLVLSGAAAIAVVHLCWRLLRPGVHGPPASLVAVALVFLPVAEGLRIGQLGIFVALVTLGGLVGLQQGRDTTAGALFGLAVIKPQAMLLVLLVVGVHVVATGRWRTLAAASASAGLAVGVSALVFPHVWAAWSAASLPMEAHSATLSGAARTAYLYLTGQDTHLPVLVVPLAVSALLLPWALRHRRSVRWDALPLLMAISVLAAPHAWVYDGAALLLIQVAAVAVWLERRPGGREVMLAALAIQAASFWYASLSVADHHHMVVLPIAMLALATVMYERGDFSAESKLQSV